MDVFAIGVLIFNLVAGFPAFTAADNKFDAYALLMEGEDKVKEFWDFQEKRNNSPF